jgi:hypothetical protein
VVRDKLRGDDKDAMDPYKHSFFSLAEIKQPVNQWLCIAFLGVWCFWIMLYYVTQKAEAIGDSYFNVIAATKTQSPRSK